MKTDAKMDPKNHPKIDGWAIRGPIFEVLGGFLRGQIFDEFSIGKKFAKFWEFGILGSAKCKKLGSAGKVGGMRRSPGNLFWEVLLVLGQVSKSVWHA